jgi:Tfp pilus assembly protein PilV
VSRAGVTIVEVLVSLVILTMGVLGFVTTATLVTRMSGRGQRAAQAAIYAQQTLDSVRTSVCAISTGLTGTNQLTRAGVVLATNHWTVVVRNADGRDVRDSLTYPGTNGATRFAIIETGESCR